MLTDGERMVVFSVLRAASAERNCDFLERTEDAGVEVESGLTLDADADADADGKWEAELEGDAWRECTGLGEEGPCSRFPIGCLREETRNVSFSTSRISLGQSL
jgi:hypothetical protein